jgi:hypothetical protein
MKKFYIRDELWEIHEVNEEEFRKTLNGMKEIWGEEYDMEIDPQGERKDCNVMQKWTFAAVDMWIIADDYEELKELGL